MAFTAFVGIPRIYDRLAAEPRVVLAEFPLYSGDEVFRNAPYLVFNTCYLQPLLNVYSGTSTAAPGRLAHARNPAVLLVGDLR